MGMVSAAHDMKCSIGGDVSQEKGRYCGNMHEAISNVLRIFRKQGHDELVLGAWGCGHPGDVAHRLAAIFRQTLLENAKIKWKFRRVVFAIPRTGQDHNYADFKGAFEAAASANPCVTHELSDV